MRAQKVPFFRGRFCRILCAVAPFLGTFWVLFNVQGICYPSPLPSRPREWGRRCHGEVAVWREVGRCWAWSGSGLSRCKEIAVFCQNNVILLLFRSFLCHSGAFFVQNLQSFLCSRLRRSQMFTVVHTLEARSK